MTEDSSSAKTKDNFAVGDKYEPYVGRWSRLVAPKFLKWFAIPAGSQWLDVGCGTGALSETILLTAEPAKVRGVDRSEGFITFAQSHIKDKRAEFEVGDAQALTFGSGSFDAVVSGLMLNFIPQPELAVAEMTRVTKQDGVAAAYVWDYAEKMQFMRHFWDAAEALDPSAAELDEGRRFSICNPEALKKLFDGAGLHNVEVSPIEISTHFRDFDDYWSPFLGGQGPAPSYLMSLSEEGRTALRERIRAGLPFSSDGSIPLVARVWAVNGIHGAGDEKTRPRTF